MRYAIASDGTQVAAHFGRCAQYELVDIEDGAVARTETMLNPGHAPGLLPRLLAERIEDDEAVIEVHELKGRNSGPYRFIEAHVVLDVHDLEQAHQVSYRLENAVREIAANIDSVLIHFEPRHRETYTYAAPLHDHEHIADHFGEARRFALVTVGSEEREIRDTRYLDNPRRDEDSGKGIRIAQTLIEALAGQEVRLEVSADGARDTA